MSELQRWLDGAPTLRRCSITFDGWKWNCEVSVLGNFLKPGETGRFGNGEGDSLTFAAVAAIMDLRKKLEG